MINLSINTNLYNSIKSPSLKKKDCCPINNAVNIQSDTSMQGQKNFLTPFFYNGHHYFCESKTSRISNHTVSFGSSAEKTKNNKSYDYTSAVCSGSSFNKSRRNMIALVKSIVADKVKISDLSDEQILDIWSWRYYDFLDAEDSSKKIEFIERFDNLCKEHTIQCEDGEVFARTIPVSPKINEEKFYLGKPIPQYGTCPAAAARIKLDLSETLPPNVLYRVVDDKVKYLKKNPSAELTDSMLYVIEPDIETQLNGFDWKQTGIVKSKEKDKKTNDFGSLVFKKEIDSLGHSTEVDFASNITFRVNKNVPKKKIPIAMKDGISFDLNIIHVKPNI